jgi:hypothetical protein
VRSQAVVSFTWDSVTEEPITVRHYLDEECMAESDSLSNCLADVIRTLLSIQLVSTPAP